MNAEAKKLNRFLQDRKASYHAKLIETIAATSHIDVTIDGEVQSVTVHNDTMIGSVFFEVKTKGEPIFIYATPGIHHIVGDEPYSESDSLIMVNIATGEGADVDVPMQLTWHDIDSDYQAYIELMKNMIPFIKSVHELLVASAKHVK